MLVSDDNSVELLMTDANFCKPSKDLPGAETGIDQNIGRFGRDQSSISG
jgi:hypothetical protein